MDIDPGKAGKVYIESVLSEKGNVYSTKTYSTKTYSKKTASHIDKLYEAFGTNKIFGRSAVMEILNLKSSGASKLLANLLKANIIELVSGHGKGKYKFKSKRL